jgi:hypothetical protein
VVVGRSLLVIPLYLCKFSSSYIHHLVRKKHDEIKKTLTNGPNDARHVDWAHYRRVCLPQASPCSVIHQKYLYVSISTEKTRRKKKYSPRAHCRPCPDLGCCCCRRGRCRAVVVLVVLWCWCCGAAGAVAPLLPLLWSLWSLMSRLWLPVVDVCTRLNKVT